MSNDSLSPSPTPISSQRNVSDEAGNDPESTPYQSATSHRHNHTVSSISHISRATIHDDDLQSTVPIPFEQDIACLENGEGEKEQSFLEKAASSHIRSKSAFVDLPHNSVPTKFESFSSSTGAAFTTNTGRRPSVVCLKVNANAARAGKHRIQHIESPALVLESGFDEGHAAPEKYSSGCSIKLNSPLKRPSHRKRISHQLTIPEDGATLTDSWSAYLDTSCDSSSKFIPGPSGKKALPRTKDSALIRKDKNHSLSFLIGEHNITLSEKEQQPVVVIEPKKPESNQDNKPPTFIISQGKSIAEALNRLSLKENPTPKNSRRSRRSHPTPRSISRLRKTLVQICTLIVDEAVRNLYDESKSQRRQRKRVTQQEIFNDIILAILKQTGNTWRRTSSHSRHRRSWNTADSISESNSDESSVDEDIDSLSESQSILTEHIRSVLRR